MRKKYYVDGDLDDDGNELDEDVVEERNRVYSDSNSDVLQVKNLFKKYEIFYLTRQKFICCEGIGGMPNLQWIVWLLEFRELNVLVC